MKWKNWNALAPTGILLLAALTACGPQKHENEGRAHQNQAQENLGRGGRHGIRIVCAADIQKFCANEDRKRRCLKDNIDKLSDACKEALAKRRGRDRDNDEPGDSNGQQ